MCGGGTWVVSFSIFQLITYIITCRTPQVNKNMPAITIFGSINYDLVTTADRFPQAGETLAATRFETHHGGKGANQAVAARRLAPGDIKVNMVGRVGSDGFGSELVKSLGSEGIDVTHVQTSSSQPTGTATIFVDQTSGENRILVYPGANGTFTEDDVPKALISESDILIVQNEIPTETVYTALSYAKLNGITTIYNPSPMPIDDNGTCNIPLTVLSDVSYLIVNSSEADQLLELVKKDNPTSGAPTQHINDQVDVARTALPVLELYGKCNVIITLGASGCILRSEDGDIVHSPAGSLPTGKQVVDTTCAGDTFLGAIAAFLAQKARISDAVRFAAKASAIAVTRRGAQESIPMLSELR